jgi:HAD superfamily hydrolase (TIGR01484 family)
MIKALPDCNKISDLYEFEQFSFIRLIVLDLDGTLLKSNDSQLARSINELTKSLKSPKYGNIKFTIATGRTFKGIEPFLKDLPILKDTPIILYNGSIVVDIKNHLIFQNSISYQSFIRLLAGHPLTSRSMSILGCR